MKLLKCYGSSRNLFKVTLTNYWLEFLFNNTPPPLTQNTYFWRANYSNLQAKKANARRTHKNGRSFSNEALSVFPSAFEFEIIKFQIIKKDLWKVTKNFMCFAYHAVNDILYYRNGSLYTDIALKTFFSAGCHGVDPAEFLLITWTKTVS